MKMVTPSRRESSINASQKPSRADRIDPRSRLVEDQYLGAVDQGDGQGQSLADAQRQALGSHVGHLTEPEPVEHFRDPPANLVRWQMEQPGVQYQVLADGQLGVERERLRHVPDSPARDEVGRVQWMAEERGRALGRRQEPGQHLHRGRLAAPVGAEEAEDFAALDPEADVVHCGERAETAGSSCGPRSRRECPLQDVGAA